MRRSPRLQGRVRLTIKVLVRQNESLEAALRRFKRQCNYSGVFRLAKAKTWHEKRSDKLRRERRERLRTIQRASRQARDLIMGHRPPPKRKMFGGPRSGGPGRG
ncbi:MAG: 30S ribosomal protein S21 [Planctomycetes bacterium]|nr:30S ribosomal protein S21 [Planctomycetota bacterium]